MNKVLVGVAVLLVGVALFFGGLFLGQADANGGQFGWMMAGGPRGSTYMAQANSPGGCPYGSGHGMMDSAYGMMQGGYGMMGNGYGMMGSAAGMMGGYEYDGRIGVEPLSIEDAEAAVTDYLASWDDDDLAVGEIMIFDNHAYVQVVDTGSDAGAFEVLVDPVSRNVYPEPGPNMMWNTRYGHMKGFGGSGMMGGMMGNGILGGIASEGEIDVTDQEAVAIAQDYLDTYLNGTTADETADAFPGYYTIHVLRDGETIGMISVNAYTGQVFLHHWHGEFLEMAGEEHG